MPSKQRKNLHAEHVPSDETDLVIETINNMNLGWKADVCKLQKHHPKYGSHCELQLSQKQSEIDLILEEKVFGEGDESQKVHEKALKFQKKYSSAQEIPD